MVQPTSEMDSLKDKRRPLLFVRILPTLEVCDCIKVDCTRKEMYVRSLQDFQKGNMHPEAAAKYWKFPTNGIFVNVSQQDIYSAVMQGVVQKALAGCDSIIFAYGQTGTGKTFTMSGLRNVFEYRGIAPRLVAQLLAEKDRLQGQSDIEYSMTCIELERGYVRDLLSPRYWNCKRPYNECFKTFKRVPVWSELEALHLLFLVESRRHTAPFAPYVGSNLGHCVVTIFLRNKSLLLSSPVATVSKIHLVDLAGIDSLSEPTTAWRSKGDVGGANTDKSLLEQCLLNMVAHPPRVSVIGLKQETPSAQKRLSNLIRYLGESLSATCLLRFVAHINCSRRNLAFTLSAMRFGERIRAVPPERLVMSRFPEPMLQLEALKSEVARLERDLDLGIMLAQSVGPSNMSQARLEQTARLAKGYLSGQVSELTLLSVGQTSITLKAFQDMFAKVEAERDAQAQKVATMLAKEEADQQRRSMTPRLSDSGGKGRSKRSLIGRKDEQRDSQTSQEQTTVNTDGEIVKSNGIALGPGMASSYEGVVTKVAKRLRGSKRGTKDVGSTTSLTSTITENTGSIQEERPPLALEVPSREKAWEAFVAAVGADVSQLLSEQTELLTTVEVAQRKYLAAAYQLATQQATADHARADLLVAQRQRHLTGEEQYDTNGRVMAGVTEVRLLEELRIAEGDLEHARQTAVLASGELQTAGAQLSENKAKVEQLFQDYCTRTYHVPVVPDLTPTALVAPSCAVRDVEVDRLAAFYREIQTALLPPATARKSVIR